MLCISANEPAQAATQPLPSQPLAVLATLPPVVLSTEQLLSLERWSREYEDWAVWFARWRNRLEPGWFSAKPRRQPPTPPAWLPGACSHAADDAGSLADACRNLKEWLDGDFEAARARQQLAASRAQAEKPEKTVWWERLHFDALWPVTQSGVNAFGVFGTHATLHLTDRLQVFLTPGVILVRVPSGDGSKQWTAGTDWGFSYKVADVRLPVVRRPSMLHLNIARVWVFGGNNLPVTRELYLAGFSLTFRSR